MLTIDSNVHGVYAPGNVRLHPELLGKHQAYVSEKLGGQDKKPGKAATYCPQQKPRKDAY